MEIVLTWQDLLKLAANGKLDKQTYKLKIGPAVLPSVQVSADGLKGFVQFKADESDPRLSAGK
jgi:hypothetical protein